MSVTSTNSRTTDNFVPNFCDDCTRVSEDNSQEVPCCYDADTSNSSMDLSHDEVSQDSHHRGFGEAAARGAKCSNFFPISEETMFLDTPANVPRITTSSPVDSWMMYSNSSSDEYSLSGQFHGGSSNEDTSDFEPTSPKKNKPKHSCKPIQYADIELEDEDDEELTPTVSHKAVTKRLRVKESHLTVASSSRPRSPSLPQVDVRMIDFAHTTIADKTNAPSSSTAVHQGPDGGFLTGIDSLKRLLLQILSEG